jgi:type II secretory pathway component PulF
MIGSPRIPLKQLASLCRRLAISFESGIEVRSVWTRETASASPRFRPKFAKVRDSVAQGFSMSEGLAKSGDFFPEFFRGLVEVGEHTGQLPETCEQLADYYEHRLQLRRTLITSLTWPAIELTMALGVVGVVIWVVGAIPQLEKQKTDLFGFGLRGNSGLAIYLAIVGAAGIAITMLVRGAARGAVWVAPVERVALRLPMVGRAFETLALARLTSALHVTLNSGMDLRKALDLSLRATQSLRYAESAPGILASIRAGDEIHEGFRRAGVFPVMFLDAVQVGEDSGRLIQSMRHLSAEYQDESRVAMHTLTLLLGYAVWGLVAVVIIFLIFRVFGAYAQILNDASKMR